MYMYVYYIFNHSYSSISIPYNFYFISPRKNLGDSLIYSYLFLFLTNWIIISFSLLIIFCVFYVFCCCWFCSLLLTNGVCCYVGLLVWALCACGRSEMVRGNGLFVNVLYIVFSYKTSHHHHRHHHHPYILLLNLKQYYSEVSGHPFLFHVLPQQQLQIGVI